MTNMNKLVYYQQEKKLIQLIRQKQEAVLGGKNERMFESTWESNDFQENNKNLNQKIAESLLTTLNLTSKKNHFSPKIILS